METKEDRRAKLENDVATKWLRLAMVTDEERSKTGEGGINHTAQVGPGDRGRKKSKRGNGFYLYFDFKNIFFSRNEFACPVLGTIFLVTVSMTSEADSR